MKSSSVLFLVFLIYRCSAEDRNAGQESLVNVGGVVGGAADVAMASVGTLVLDEGPLGVMTRMFANSLRLIGIDPGVRTVVGTPSHGLAVNSTNTTSHGSPSDDGNIRAIESRSSTTQTVAIPDLLSTTSANTVTVEGRSVGVNTSKTVAPSGGTSTNNTVTVTNESRSIAANHSETVAPSGGKPTSNETTGAIESRSTVNLSNSTL